MSPLSRPWFATFVAGCTCAGLAWGQSETTAGSSTPAGGASSAPETGATGATSTFGSGFSIYESSTPASGESAAPRAFQEAAPSFIVPGFYGQGSQTFYGGVGRLARPKYELSLSLSVGYDDNVFQTPRDTPRFLPGGSSTIDEPEPVFQIIPGTDGQFVTVQRPIFNNGIIVIGDVIEFVPGEPETRVRLPDPIPAEVVGSFFSRASFGFQMQQFTRTSLLTIDSRAGATYYLEKDSDPLDYDGAISLTFLHRFTPRLQIVTVASVNYLAQPDYSIPNTPERSITGDLIYTALRVDAAYRFTPRFSMTGTGAYVGQRYTEAAEQTSDSNEFTFGVEARYLWKPRWTVLTEFRHSMRTYDNNPALDSTSDYLLLGSEFILNPRLNGSLRVGLTRKEFTESGDSQVTPHLESTVSYRSTSRSTVTWTNRFGFEEPGAPGDERLVYRANISYIYVFSPRLRGSAGINLLHEVTTSKATGNKFAQDTFDANVGLFYQLTRDFNLNGSYSFTITNSNTRVSDYYRSRVSVGAEYAF